MILKKKNITTVGESEYAYYLNKMPDDKQKNISAYRKDEDKKRSVCGYMLALKTLSEFMNKNEKEVSVSYDENGKPVTEGCFLSIAHAGDYAICAVSDKPIGVDAEILREVKLTTALRVCTENELIYIFADKFDSNIPEKTDIDVSARFLEVWTKKEAYGKMHGTGILYDMKNTDVLHIDTVYDGELIISVCQQE